MDGFILSESVKWNVFEYICVRIHDFVKQISFFLNLHDVCFCAAYKKCMKAMC